MLRLILVKSSLLHHLFAPPGLEVGMIYLQHLTSAHCLPFFSIKTTNFDFQPIRLYHLLTCLSTSLTDSQVTVTCTLKFSLKLILDFLHILPMDLTYPVPQPQQYQPSSHPGSACSSPIVLVDLLTECQVHDQSE